VQKINPVRVATRYAKWLVSASPDRVRRISNG